MRTITAIAPITPPTTAPIGVFVAVNLFETEIGAEVEFAGELDDDDEAK
jgi:hypothetical protein